MRSSARLLRPGALRNSESGEPRGSALEANRLVVPGRCTHVAERQPIFDEGGSAAALAGHEGHRVLAYRAAGLLRVHAITWIRHPWISLVRGWATASLLATGADGREFATAPTSEVGRLT